MQTIILGGGCFWCTESVFLAVKGVQSVTSGYMGGTSETADYQTVCTGTTDHAEVVKVVFDDKIVPLNVLLDIFFTTHDPTTPNRQGNDIGTQYRSVVFYVDTAQSQLVEQKISELKQQGINVVTQVVPASDHEFYVAENYHQDFFHKNPSQGYCNFAIPPKLAKLRASFSQYMNQ